MPKSTGKKNNLKKPYGKPPQNKALKVNRSAALHEFFESLAVNVKLRIRQCVAQCRNNKPHLREQRINTTGEELRQMFKQKYPLLNGEDRNYCLETIDTVVKYLLTNGTDNVLWVDKANLRLEYVSKSAVKSRHVDVSELQDQIDLPGETFDAFNQVKSTRKNTLTCDIGILAGQRHSQLSKQLLVLKLIYDANQETFKLSESGATVFVSGVINKNCDCLRWTQAVATATQNIGPGHFQGGPSSFASGHELNRVGSDRNAFLTEVRQELAHHQLQLRHGKDAVNHTESWVLQGIKHIAGQFPEVVANFNQHLPQAQQLDKVYAIMVSMHSHYACCPECRKQIRACKRIREIDQACTNAGLRVPDHANGIRIISLASADVKFNNDAHPGHANSTYHHSQLDLKAIDLARQLVEYFA